MDSPTPMLKQYQTIKSKHKDAILFFRLGDFYEMFFDDATEASSILDLVLTARGKGTANKVPMCGVPYHSAENYIAKLIKAGKKVAICEQVEDPTTAKGIVKRDVIRTITASTYLDDSTESRYLLALFPEEKTVGVAFIDTATGNIQTNQFTNIAQTIELMSKLPIYECIFPESSQEAMQTIFQHPLLKTRTISLTPFSDWCFNPEMANKSLCDHFGTQNLKGFGIDDMPHAQGATGAILEYLKAMSKQPLRHIDRISLYDDGDYVFISPAAHYGLEMHSLLQTLDKTLTPMGKRGFRFWLYHPLKDPARITQRQEAIKLLNESDIELAPLLKNMPDIEKSISRLSSGYSSPKDVLAIRNSLLRAPDIKETMAPIAEHNLLFSLDDISELRLLLEKAINPDMPLSKYEGKVIRPGYNQEFDELRDIQENGHQWLKNFQAEEIKRTGINTLKVGFNKVFGYYIEITKANAKLVPETYIRKQTLVNAERYITPELKEYEEKILSAQEKVFQLENQLLKEIQQAILDESATLHNYSEQIATLDILYSLSLLAAESNYCFPEMSTDTVLDIRDGRHPVVESQALEDFIPNDTLLDCEESHLIILTGPNMAGKSTYIRQTAILVIMAQMGSAIPASSAHIGVVDKIFTRIGAHDEIAKGQSTFMVEMTEAADIINNLSDRSLIILDEIGRGTSTSDGLSLAWALAEYLQGKQVRTLFATHFHELVALADQFKGVKNYNVAVKEWEDKIIFMHKIIPGGSDDSYGIYVAKLAGIPDKIINRSKSILSEMEIAHHRTPEAPKESNENQLDLFSAPGDPIAQELREALEKLNLNNLTPLEALNTLNSWKTKLDS